MHDENVVSQVCRLRVWAYFYIEMKKKGFRSYTKGINAEVVIYIRVIIIIQQTIVK